MADSVTFDHSIYIPDSIVAAAGAYSELLSIELATSEGETTASFSDLDAEEGEMLVDAFCNHVLFETIQRARVTGAQA